MPASDTFIFEAASHLAHTAEPAEDSVPQSRQKTLSEQKTGAKHGSRQPPGLRKKHRQEPVLLPEQYYLDNFKYLIEFVAHHYRHLLTREEHRYCEAFAELTDNAQQLYARLVLRAPTHFRVGKISYENVKTEPALHELDKHGFAQLNCGSVESCLPLFTNTELQAAFGSRVTNTDIDTQAWTTPDLFGDSPIVKLLHDDEVTEIKGKEWVVTFRLLFFGNLYQDFSDFVLRDLGFQRFESYAIDGDTLLFQSRDQINAHLACHQVAEHFDEASAQGAGALHALYKQLPIGIPDDKTLSRRLDRLKNKIARQLEREAQLEHAAEIYTKTIHPPARERLARILAKQGLPDQALTLCRQIAESPLDCDELEFAASFGAKLAKQLDAWFDAEPKYSPPEISLHLEKTGTREKKGLAVEFSVALHLAKTGKCYYLENHLLSAVFGLAFWDIIFAPVNGAFFHPFQSKPADFYEPEFVSSRQSLIDQRLADIANGNLRHYVNKYSYFKRGLQNPLVNWAMCRRHVLNLALQRIPCEHWHAVFCEFLTDIRHYRSGQPDLVYFPDDGADDNRYQLLEVKAPGDTLQKNQLRWMRFFNQQNMPHGVVHVKWIDD